MNVKQLLALKEKMKAKLPEFKHYDSHKRKEVDPSWRKPRGLHNKMRKGIHGRPVSVNVGYRTPVAVRYMTKDGLLPSLVYSIVDLGNLDPKVHGVLLGGVGKRKKTILLQACKDKKFIVLNVKDVDSAIQSIAEQFASRKKIKAESAKQKAEKVKQKVAKKEEKKEMPVEEKKEQAKKEMDKVLMRKE